MNKSKKAYIIFNAEIDDKTAHQFIKALVECNNNNEIEEIIIAISSTGGLIYPSMEMYSLLKSIKKKIKIHNIGQVNSMANVIFLGVKERFANKSSIFIFHNLENKIENSSTIEQIRGVADLLEENFERVVNIISDNTTMDKPEIKKLHIGEIVMKPDKAKKVNIIQNISEFVLEPNSKIIQIP